MPEYRVMVTLSLPPALLDRLDEYARRGQRSEFFRLAAEEKLARIEAEGDELEAREHERQPA
jgi:metal-responsive CopG/Arc/MetJ family transcriptional regulator